MLKQMRDAETLAGVFRAIMAAEHHSRHEEKLVVFLRQVQRETLEHVMMAMQNKSVEARLMVSEMKADPVARKIEEGVWLAAKDEAEKLIPR